MQNACIHDIIRIKRDTRLLKPGKVIVCRITVNSVRHKVAQLRILILEDIRTVLIGAYKHICRAGNNGIVWVIHKNAPHCALAIHAVPIHQD